MTLGRVFCVYNQKINRRKTAKKLILFGGSDKKLGASRQISRAKAKTPNHFFFDNFLHLLTKNDTWIIIFSMTFIPYTHADKIPQIVLFLQLHRLMRSAGISRKEKAV